MNRDFKGVWIPKEIWINKDLSLIEKCFFIEIDSLSSGERGCFASNKHFSQHFDVTKGRCSQIIRSLAEKNYIEIEIKREGKLIVERIIRVVNKLNRGVVNKLNNPSKKIKQPYLENDKESNTKSNNTNTNNSKKKREKKRILFKNSPLSNFLDFENHFKKEFSKYNLKYYYERVSSWSKDKQQKKIDWFETVSSWIKQDEAQGVAKLNPEYKKPSELTLYRYDENKPLQERQKEFLDYLNELLPSAKESDLKPFYKHCTRSNGSGVMAIEKREHGIKYLFNKWVTSPELFTK